MTDARSDEEVVRERWPNWESYEFGDGFPEFYIVDPATGKELGYSRESKADALCDAAGRIRKGE